MKNYIVTSTCVIGNRKDGEFDILSEAIKYADKRQKTRKAAIVVLEKYDETEIEIFYKERYNAKGEPLIPVKYTFIK